MPETKVSKGESGREAPLFVPQRTIWTVADCRRIWAIEAVIESLGSIPTHSTGRFGIVDGARGTKTERFL